MFNDLNKTNQPESKIPVDDIFADTDKSAEAKKFSGYYANSNVPSGQIEPTEVETQKSGLSSTEELPASSKGKILKIGLIILLIILLFGLGYLVYAKFLAGKNTDQNLISTPATTTIPTTTTNNTPPVTNVNTTTPFGQDLNSTGQASGTIPVSEEIIITPSIPLATTTPIISSLTDSDSDGLTDEEEKILGTNSNNKDTDEDGLSDYEEVKIYKTDSLKTDTDGDGYSDGAEVKGGYNPLGTGKMIDIKK